MKVIFFDHILNQINWYLLKPKLKNIKLVISDVDGVLTDGSIYFSDSGEQIRKFNVKDGLGIKLLQENGIEVAIISGGKGDCIIQRAKGLNIKNYFTEIKNKQLSVKDLQEKLSISISQTAFIGDDLNDINVKKEVSLLVAPSDASYEYKKNSNCFLSKKGGNGAFREFAEKILKAKRKFSKIKDTGWIGNN